MKKLGYGLYNKKQHITNLIIFFVFVLSLVALIVLIAFNVIPHIVISSFFCLCIILLFLIIESSPLLKIQKKFLKSCNVNEYINKIDSLIDEELLDNDTNNFLKINKANVLYLIDKDEAREIMDSIDEALIKKNDCLLYYVKMKIVDRINYEDFEEAHKLCDKYKIKYPKFEKSINQMEKLISMFDSKVLINNVDKIYKITTISLYNNIINASYLMYYYENRIDVLEDAKDKAVVNAQYIVDNIIDKRLDIPNLEKEAEYIVGKYNKK